MVYLVERLEYQSSRVFSTAVSILFRHCIYLRTSLQFTQDHRRWKLHLTSNTSNQNLMRKCSRGWILEWLGWTHCCGGLFLVSFGLIIGRFVRFVAIIGWCSDASWEAFLRPFGSKSRFADSENKLRSSLIQCMSSWAAEDVESGNSYRRFANSNWIIFTYCILLLLCNFSRIIAIHRPIGLVDAQQKTRGKADDKHVLKAVAAYPVQGASSKLQRIINDPKASIPTYRTMPVFFFFFLKKSLLRSWILFAPFFQMISICSHGSCQSQGSNALVSDLEEPVFWIVSN